MPVLAGAAWTRSTLLERMAQGYDGASTPARHGVAVPRRGKGSQKGVRGSTSSFTKRLRLLPRLLQSPLQARGVVVRCVSSWTPRYEP
jgi:hypothetical protein